MIPTSRYSRREFFKLSAAAGALLGLSSCASQSVFGLKEPRSARKIAPGQKIRVAQIGFGGKGNSDLRACATAGEEIVALCDIDWGRANIQKMFKDFPRAKQYKDFRRMLIEMDDQIDAVGIATPDHMHFLPAMMAILMGKHVYLQKPLTQTVSEARELRRLAKMTGVCTQMGNQGHAGEGVRLMREWFEAGLLGDVKEVHIWTDRPIWPQGMKEWPAAEPTPANIAWEEFIGKAPMRPFSKAIHPFKWRGYFEYGCGALGDMAIHFMDAPNFALRLGPPSKVEPTVTEGMTSLAFPNASEVTFHFPARGSMPPVKIYWYEGGRMPKLPDEIKDLKLPKNGQLWIGSKAILFEAEGSPRLVPDTAWQAVKTKLPPKTIPRVPKANPHEEWLAAVRAGKPEAAGSYFDYSAPFAETVLLGVVAQRIGKAITWDAEKMKTNLPEADALLYPTYRKGWEPEDLTKLIPTAKA